MSWQPIETAPKDGTEIILAGQFRNGQKWDIRSGFYSMSRSKWPYVGESYPTHWMPLPEAPK